MHKNNQVRRLFVEKEKKFDVEAKEILRDLKENLKINGLEKVRALNRYDVSGLSLEEFEIAVPNVFSDSVTDNVYKEEVDLSGADFVFAIEALPGQYDQRADFASQCIQVLTCKEKPECVAARVIALYGDFDSRDREKILSYLINPVECREASLEKPESLSRETDSPSAIKTLSGFISLDRESLIDIIKEMGLAMSLEDLICVQEYFITEKRDPTITELTVLDTYWSDHCRHTTFLTRIESAKFSKGKICDEIKSSFDLYNTRRSELYEDFVSEKPVTLMDMATLAMKEMKKSGQLDNLDESDEINACSIKVPVVIDGVEEDYLVMFKNETHNHPTEIEPFGGAATCLGGAIRDPLSGRSYVYQAMRITGSADPTVPVEQTIPGKLSQRQITTKAAAGYSSYGNQIGLAAGLIEEIYHPGYMAKRMELGAVIAAAPEKNVIRQKPRPGDLVILLGGRTGRDGCGGATGSSKEHDEKSIHTCSSEVQKGNPPTERKIQRLFRNPQVSTLIKKCNDFGAGGVCVAIGELADGLSVDLDKVPKKYEGLDGTELAISESQERMAVLVSAENEKKFIEYALEENLEAVTVAKVTGKNRFEMLWRNEKIFDISREFINTSGASQKTTVEVESPDPDENYFKKMPEGYDETSFKCSLKAVLKSLDCCSRRGLVERFDSTVGAGTVLMPFAGRTQSSPEVGMAAKIPVEKGNTNTSTVMTFGFDPGISQWSPYHGANYAVLESLSKMAAIGADPLKARLSFQEYFEKLGNNPKKWGKPFSALLGAYKAQTDFQTPSIGGKDSMSGTFNDLNVPPTLVSFAVGITQAQDITSACFQKSGSEVICLPVVRNDLDLPDKDIVISQYSFLKKLRENEKVLSASTVREGGIAVAVSKMAFGNMLGFKFDESVENRDLFSANTASILVEVDELKDKIMKYEAFKELLNIGGCFILGKTVSDPVILSGTESISLQEAKDAWESTLENVFPSKYEQKEKVEYCVKQRDVNSNFIVSNTKFSKPTVFIPVFPGTNCEYDTAKAFEDAGAKIKTVIFRNMTSEDIEESIETMSRAINESQIVMLPGGFSAGDEPDGSGRFVAAAFKNPYIAEQIHKLLYERDGLILGICNGFQALIKLGLLPYGEIKQPTRKDPTLTYNTIGRHVSGYVRTKIVTDRSPWLYGTIPGEVYLVPVSHGEGRFVCDEDMIKALCENSQIATQYVDEDGNPAFSSPHNPNGSFAAIEGITALDGRIFGKMGHSERKGRYVAKNIPGVKEQRIFEAGVKYFK